LGPSPLQTFIVLDSGELSKRFRQSWRILGHCHDMQIH